MTYIASAKDVARDGKRETASHTPRRRMALIRRNNPDLQAAARPGRQEQNKVRAHDPSANPLAMWESEGGATGPALLHFRDTDVTSTAPKAGLKSTDSAAAR
jgi:hypothetical protein